MAKVIIMPKLGFTQEEGRLVEWHKKVGETVYKGEPFFDVHTDKSVVTIEAAEEGVLLKIAAETGTALPVFTPIAVVGEYGEDPDAALEAHVMDEAPDKAVEADFGAEEPQREKKEAAVQVVSEKELKLTPKARRLIHQEGYELAEIAKLQGTGFQGGITAKDIKASPLARGLAKKLGVELPAAGSGVNGKVMKEDVLQAAKAPSSSQEKKVAYTTPYSGVRRIIGQRLSESKFTAPHLYFTDSVDVTGLTEFRQMLREKGEVKAAVSDLLAVAVSKVLRQFPEINSSLLGDSIVTYESTNIGLAVAGDQGLVVPVVKNVQEKSLSQVAAESRDLVERARTGRLASEEYSGGTFTISNLGMFGIENFTAIINPPESAILAVSSVRKKPVVVTNQNGEDELAIRPMMNLQLSVDHRVIDGLLAVRFLAALKGLLEEPIKILL